MAWFVNHKKDFLKMLDDQAAKTEECLDALAKFLENPSEESAVLTKQIEEEADELRRVLMDELNHTFVTALDREDIYVLSKAIDDVADYAETTAEEMMLFSIKTDEHIKKMVELLRLAAKDIHLAVRSMKEHPEVCLEHLRRVRKNKNAIEDAYRRGLVELFKTENVVQILKTREVYRHLSNAADRAVEAANILGGIMVKIS